MSWLSCERMNVSPWRLTTSWIASGEQRRMNSPSSPDALPARGIPSTVTSPSSHARICRSTLRLISHLHPVHHACKTNLPFLHTSGWVAYDPHRHCSFLADRAFLPPALPSPVVRPIASLRRIPIRLP